MKRIFFALIMLVAFLPSLIEADQFGQRAVSVYTVNAGASTSIKQGARYVRFIFHSSFAGTIGNASFTSSDVPILIEADPQSTLAAIPYTCTAGTMVVVEVR